MRKKLKQLTFVPIIAVALAIPNQALGEDIWSGPYIGTFLSHSSVKIESDATARPDALGNGFGVAEIADAMVGSMTYSQAERSGSFAPGIFAGYQWAKDAFVLGLEMDAQRGGSQTQTGERITQLDRFPANHQVYQYEQVFDIDYLATVRGRVGYASDTWMVYLTGGLAIADVSTNLNSYAPLLGPTAPPPSFVRTATQKSQVNVGAVIGAGGEVAISDQIKLRAEYLYYDLSSIEVNSGSRVDYNTGALFSSAVGEVSSGLTGSVARVGLVVSF